MTNVLAVSTIAKEYDKVQTTKQHLEVAADMQKNVTTQNTLESTIASLAAQMLQNKKMDTNKPVLITSFVRLDEFKKTTFYETLLNNGFNKKDLEDCWYKLKQRVNGELAELGYREYFLIEIQIIDEYVYLLEIGKKESESSYLGVIFRDSTFNKLSNKELTKILKKVVENEGNYSKKDPSITDVKKLKAVDLGVKYEKYSHKFDKKLKKFINLADNIKNKINYLNDSKTEIKT